MTDQVDGCERRDLVRRPAGFMIAWGLPLFILVAVGFVDVFLSPAAEVIITAGAFAWMGGACLINAARCGRLHCFVSGPILLIAGALIVFWGFDLMPLGDMSIPQISLGAAVLALSSFGLEFVWGAYVRRGSKKGA